MIATSGRAAGSGARSDVGAGSDGPIRIANCSGFYGDRRDACREVVEGGPIDVLTGDYLAELTMLILFKTRQRKGSGGFASTFLAQMEEVLGTCMDRGIRVVTNAGGLDPAGLAQSLQELSDRLGAGARIAWIDGDDLLARLPELRAGGETLAHLDRGILLAEEGVVPVTANAYLGAWGIAEALRSGADVVVCPRVTDASLVVGPAAWRFGWSAEDYDAIAGAIVAGHVIECGAQATGGNFAFFEELAETRDGAGSDMPAGAPGFVRWRLPGMPIAEVYADGSAVITKHPGTGGAVTVDTVKAQLLYEIAGARYPNPDAVARFDTMRVVEEGPDRVRIEGTVGEAPPPTTKVAINYVGGYKNTMTFVLTGLAVEAKASLVTGILAERLGGFERFRDVDIQLVRAGQDGAPTNELASSYLRVTVKDPDPEKVGRAFSDAAVELVLSSYPGCYLSTPPTREQAYGVYWPTLVANDVIDQRVHLPGVAPRHIPPPGGAPMPAGEPPVAAPQRLVGGQAARVRVPLGRCFGARSGDKGGNANVGIWARRELAWSWLYHELTVERFRELLPEAEGLEVRRYVLANIQALNFVVVGLLGEGVASSTRSDPQAKSLGEYVRSRLVELPIAVIDESVPEG